MKKIDENTQNSEYKNLKIIRDKLKSQNLGYGFVEFENTEIAKEILEEMNGKPIPDTNK